jgi:hypothetical protein
MHNVALDRIRSQVQGIPPMQTAAITVIEIPENPPISRDELRVLLLDLFKEEAPIVIIPASPLTHFVHLWSFVEWYEPNKEKFNEQQRQALDTLLQTRDMVNTGCPCKRAHRESAANEYFKSFWLNNQDNDLIPSVLKHTGSDKIQFANFLVYPA